MRLTTLAVLLPVVMLVRSIRAERTVYSRRLEADGRPVVPKDATDVGGLGSLARWRRRRWSRRASAAVGGLLLLAPSVGGAEAHNDGEKASPQLRGFSEGLGGTSDALVLEAAEVEDALRLFETAAHRAGRAGEDARHYLMHDPERRMQHLDANGDGKVDEEEFSDAMQRDLLGWRWFKERGFDLPAARAWMHSVFASADLNSDGALDDPEEVRHADISAFAQALEMITRVMVGKLDNSNPEGKVDWSEVTSHVMTPRRKPEVATMLEYARDGFADADLDRDRALSSTELYRLSASLLAHAPTE